MAMIDDAKGIKVAPDLVATKQLPVAAEVGERVLDEKGRERTVKAITVDENNNVRYKLDDTHDLVQIAEDKNEVTFQCSYCQRVVAFALPGRGEPHAAGKPGAWRPHPEFAKWMDPCST